MATDTKAIDPLTGIPVVLALVDDDVLTGTYMSTCPTGEARFGRNMFPGTDPNAPGNAHPGLPYGFLTVPSTGTLIRG